MSTISVPIATLKAGNDGCHKSNFEPMLKVVMLPYSSDSSTQTLQIAIICSNFGKGNNPCYLV